MLRVTADTNILVSGLVYKRGKPEQFLKLALAGEINLTVSQPIVDEIMDVLSRKFGAMRLLRRNASYATQRARCSHPCGWT